MKTLASLNSLGFRAPVAYGVVSLALAYASGALLPVISKSWGWCSRAPILVELKSGEWVAACCSSTGSLYAHYVAPAQRIYFDAASDGPDWKERFDRGPNDAKPALKSAFDNFWGPSVVIGGWPAYSVRGYFEPDREQHDGSFGPVTYGALVVTSAGQWDYMTVMPLRPIWSGLFLNATLLWVLATGIHWAASAYRRRARRKAQNCPQCGHRLIATGVGVCPECGTAAHAG